MSFGAASMAGRLPRPTGSPANDRFLILATSLKLLHRAIGKVLHVTGETTDLGGLTKGIRRVVELGALVKIHGRHVT